MLKVKKNYSFLCALICFGITKVYSAGEIFLADYEELKNEKNLQLQSNEKEENTNNVEDIYDDYIRIEIFEGPELRAALRNKNQLWRRGIVPYNISNVFRNEDKQLILDAMEDFHNATCIRFRQRKTERSYISIVPGGRCSAILGNTNKESRLMLGRNCLVKGTVIHELMHTLGFFHEQNRPDRDDYVRIMYDNIRPGTEKNFEKLSSDTVQTLNQTYDYGSIMHYGAYDFAKNSSRPTIIPLRRGVRIGQRNGFSKTDVIKIDLLYCQGEQDSENKTDTTVNRTKIIINGTEIIEFGTEAVENGTEIIEFETEAVENGTEIIVNGIETIANKTEIIVNEENLEETDEGKDDKKNRKIRRHRWLHYIFHLIGDFKRRH